MAPATPAEGLKKMITPLIIPTNISPYSQPTPPLTPKSPSTLHPLTASPPPPPPTLLTLPYTRLLGTGAWSHVYALSDASTAVKTPSNPSARPIIEEEARILHYLSHALPSPCGVAAFKGYDASSASVYMELVPSGTLEDTVLSKAAEGKAGIRAPVIGMPQWIFLAERLCATFTALKRVGVVHGDVKWGNILLREYTPDGEDAVWSEYVRTGATLYEPVVVDFSSSHFVCAGGGLPDAVSAVTTAFAAPELLQSFLSRPSSPGGVVTPPVTPTGLPHPVPTFASDLYSLAVSLLAAAVGSEVYYNAGRHVGIYVRQGNPVGWVKADERGMRVGRGGVVASVLEGCFGKTAEGRVGVEEVAGRVEGWKRRWWSEGRGGGRWGC